MYNERHAIEAEERGGAPVGVDAVVRDYPLSSFKGPCDLAEGVHDPAVVQFWRHGFNNVHCNVCGLTKEEALKAAGLI